jgi:hypothetical protein
MNRDGAQPESCVVVVVVEVLVAERGRRVWEREGVREEREGGQCMGGWMG